MKFLTALRFPFRACNIFTSIVNIISLLLHALMAHRIFPSFILWLAVAFVAVLWIQAVGLHFIINLVVLLFTMHSCPHLTYLSGCHSFFKACYHYVLILIHTPSSFLLCSISTTLNTCNTILSGSYYQSICLICPSLVWGSEPLSSVLLFCMTLQESVFPLCLPCLALWIWFRPAQHIT